MLKTTVWCVISTVFVFTGIGASYPPNEFYGIHIHNHRSTNLNLPWEKGLNFRTIRLWDTGTIWAALEPTKGQYNFAPVDRYITLAKNYSLDVILTLGVPPLWAAKDPTKPSPYGDTSSCSPPKHYEDWENYIFTLATRYKGVIKYWEVWNEPDIFWDSGFFCGSISELAELTKRAYNVLKAVDPENKVISPSVTQLGIFYLFFYLRLAHDYIDIVGFHYYTHDYIMPPWAIKVIAFFVRMSKEFFLIKGPLWHTEGGFSICKNEFTKHCERIPGNIRPAKEQEHLLRELVRNSYESGVERWCIYALNNRQFTHLVDDKETNLTSTGEVMKDIMRKSNDY
eukprot:TRINITY_DN88874_c0_g1_i1.p1 TRINITY_DN88874_c0_g1~~TRINITY_DN88874_c0_g1_i1.p1  ORF type:complete len:377 (-),score=9.49 TRINITY_DN88874_c0_g1_i1:78-1097(-)